MDSRRSAQDEVRAIPIIARMEHGLLSRTSGEHLFVEATTGFALLERMSPLPPDVPPIRCGNLQIQDAYVPNRFLQDIDTADVYTQDELRGRFQEAHRRNTYPPSQIDWIYLTLAVPLAGTQ